MEHYKRDQRLVCGIKRGRQSLLKLVTIDTASKVAQGIQALLDHADDVMGVPSVHHNATGLERPSRSLHVAPLRKLRTSIKLEAGLL